MPHKHHTKVKGDQGLGFVIADLMSKGLQVALPISEHLPFDLIAISPEGKLSRVSVKYRKKKKGCVQVEMASSWSNAAGCHTRNMERGEVDSLAIYCPDNGFSYYIRDDEIITTTISLRIDPPSKFAAHTVKYRWAKDYLDPLAIF